jgi:hypothetical protein
LKRVSFYFFLMNNSQKYFDYQGPFLGDRGYAPNFGAGRTSEQSNRKE